MKGLVCLLAGSHRSHRSFWWRGKLARKGVLAAADALDVAITGHFGEQLIRIAPLGDIGPSHDVRYRQRPSGLLQGFNYPAALI